MKYYPYLLVILFFTGCQAFFTNSPLSQFQRDPSNYTDVQKIEWAEDVMDTGDTEKIQEAYGYITEMLVDDPTDTELNLLAARLAVGASGMNDIVEEVLTSGGSTSIDDIIASSSLDTAVLTSVPGYVNTVLANGDNVPDETLAVAAATSVLIAADNNVNLAPLETWDPSSGPLTGVDQSLIDATVFILAMSSSSSTAEQLASFFN